MFAGFLACLAPVTTRLLAQATSMDDVSPFICYGSVVVYFGAVLALITVGRHAIESRRFMGIAICLVVSFALLVTMVAYNEALVTALFPTVLIVGLYLSVEDPSAQRLCCVP